ncbi:peptidase M75 superfamily protein [Christiangramia fulva]|uniref:Peptidase M75 superfamily protein n=1 Tax=Christiangramia fulva TaxID=2126553 RepID=A0A2R3Z129_9FLAO|nr:imelysin family protein [Christiangramia fulva]AVR43948.1 peptidase M75 superfamily protein [Christiangramia fulva]
MKRITGILLVFTLVFAACSKDDEGGSINPNNFDRQGMLANWADNIIIPAFSNFKNSTQDLEDKTTAFTSDPSEANLAELRAAFETAYLDFQTVSMFEIGKAMEINFRHFLNTYPADASAIEANIAGDYDLTSVNAYDQQGFPALDYMINGLGETDAEIAAKYASEDYKTYLENLASRINSLTAEVNSSWQGDFRDQFVNNTSSSSTGSIDKFTNDYIMYFEKFIRSGKIGFPAGAFTGTPSPGNVEAYYSEDFSRALYIKALESVQDFFNGKHFGSSETGKSFSQYINYMQPAMETENLASQINAQFDAIISQAETLNESLAAQVQNDNSKMLAAFDELQKAVVLLKVDMIQVLYIGVDYVDSDGD